MASWDRKWIPFFLLQFVLLVNGYCQIIPVADQERFLQNFKHLAEDTIEKRTEIDKPFVIGRMHHITGNSINHPYFSDYRPVSGSLVFNNKTYAVDGLQYDVQNDKLVYRYHTSNFELNSVALDENFISQFSIYNATFRYFSGLKTDGGRKLKDGYYEVVYDGNLKFLVRSEVLETFEVNVTRKFNLSRRMFLLKEGLAVNIKNKAQLLSHFKNKKQDVKKYIKQNHIQLKLKNYSSVSEVLRYYESLF